MVAATAAGAATAAEAEAAVVATEAGRVEEGAVVAGMVEAVEALVAVEWFEGCSIDQWPRSYPRPLKAPELRSDCCPARRPTACRILLFRCRTDTAPAAPQVPPPSHHFSVLHLLPSDGAL